VRLPAAVALHRTTDVERLLRGHPGTPKPGHDDPKTSIDSTSGYTPLHAAAWHGNVSAIDVLMKHGADVRAREEKYHGTPAGWADYAGHKEARDLILRGPIDIIEMIQCDMAQRVKAVPGRPRSVEPGFRRLRTVSLRSWHGTLRWPTAVKRSYDC
jgi:hypothetical protein